MLLPVHLFNRILGLLMSIRVVYASMNLFQNGLQSSLYGHFLSLIPQASPQIESAKVAKHYLPAGYIYMKLSNGKTDNLCSKTTVTAGIPVNTCIVGGASSYKVQLQTDSCSGAVVQVFKDSNCSSLKPAVASVESVADKCTPYNGQHDITVGGVTVTVPLYFWTLTCTAQPSKPILVSSAALELYSDTSACNDYLGYVSVAPDLCLPVNNGLASIALKCTKSGAVNLMQYFGGGCGLSVGKTSYPVNTCAAASSALPKGYVRTTGTAPEADAFFSEKSAPTTQRASSLEAPFPTSLPRTQANERSTTEEDIAAELALAMSAGGTEVASFIASCVQPNNNYAAIVSVKQIITAVDFNNFMVNAASNNLALQKTIAACLLTTASNNRGLPAGSVRWNDVFITSVLPVPSAANSQAREAEREAVLSSPSPSLAVTYTVLSYHATVNNTELANALQESVNSGAFDVQLRQSAASEGATALALASSETLTVNALPDVVDDVSDGNGNGGGGGGGGGGSGGGGGGGGIEDGSGGAGDGAGEPVVASTGEASTSSQNLSGSALIGVIIGGVSVLLLVCAGVVYYLFYSAPSGKGATLVTQTSPRTVVAVTYGGVDEVKQCCAVVVEANCSGHAV